MRPLGRRVSTVQMVFATYSKNSHRLTKQTLTPQVATLMAQNQQLRNVASCPCPCAFPRSEMTGPSGTGLTGPSPERAVHQDDPLQCTRSHWRFLALPGQLQLLPETSRALEKVAHQRKFSLRFHSGPPPARSAGP